MCRCYARFRKSPWVEGAMTGLRPAVVGLIGAALVSMGRSVFFPTGFVLSPVLAVSAGIFALSTLLAFRKRHPILIIGLCAALGVAAGYALGL